MRHRKNRPNIYLESLASGQKMGSHPSTLVTIWPENVSSNKKGATWVMDKPLRTHLSRVEAMFFVVAAVGEISFWG